MSRALASGGLGLQAPSPFGAGEPHRVFDDVTGRGLCLGFSAPAAS